MKIFRDPKKFIIQLPLYKVNIKKIPYNNKTGFQYSSILPPFLCSYFNIEDTIKEPNLLFYVYDSAIYITTVQSLLDLSAISSKLKEIETYVRICKANGTEIPENLEKEYTELPKINYKIYDNIETKVITTAYKLTNSNSFRVTLPNKLFKDKIVTTENNYIQFTIDTLNKDFLNNYGVVKIDILQE